MLNSILGMDTGCQIVASKNRKLMNAGDKTSNNSIRRQYSMDTMRGR